MMGCACVIALAGCATEHQETASKKPASLTRSSSSYQPGSNTSTGSITPRAAPAPAPEISAEEKVRAEREEIKHQCALRRNRYLLGMLKDDESDEQKRKNDAECAEAHKYDHMQ